MTAGISKLTRPHGPGMSDAGRVVACATAIASIAAGVIHISAAADHENLPVMMAGFLIVAMLQVGLGGLLIWRRPSALLIAVALALMLSSLGLWLVSRTAGLPFLEGGHMEPIGFKDGVTVLFELAALPGLALLLSRELSGFTMPARLGTQAVGMLGAAAFVLLMPAFLADGGAHHSHDEAVAMGIHDDGHGENAEHADAHTDAGDHGDGDGAGADEHADAAGHGAAGHTDHVGTGEELASLITGAGGHGHGTDTHRQTAGREHGDGDAQHEDGHGETDRPRTHQHGGDHEGDAHDEGQSHTEDDDHAHGGEQPQEDPGADSAGSGPVAYDGGGEGRGALLTLGTPKEKQDQAAHGDHDAPCDPTPEQQAAADKLAVDTELALRKYYNNPAQLVADGFELVFHGGMVWPPRFVHVFNAQRSYDDVVLDPAQIESVMLAMTDEGLIPIGGMYMMPAEWKDQDIFHPKEPSEGPKIGGCRTKWHDHPDLAKPFNRSGAPTPEMLHVWTHPDLEPYGEYEQTEIAPLWTTGNLAPTVKIIPPGP